MSEDLQGFSITLSHRYTDTTYTVQLTKADDLFPLYDGKEGALSPKI